jgi:hypothetical protein
MHVCMYVLMYVYMHRYSCVYVCTDVCTYMHKTHTYMHVNYHIIVLSTPTRAHTNKHTHTHTQRHDSSPNHCYSLKLQVRSVRGLPRGGPRGSRHGFELQDFMFERGLDARSMEHHALLTGGRPQADLRRQYSCFELGDINRDGYTAPKNRLDVGSEHTSLPPLPVVSPSQDTLSPTSIQVSFRLASVPAGEMYKVKTAVQLKTLLDGSAGNVAGILFIDASSRPPAGQSWPRHIHSASTMVKVRKPAILKGVYVCMYVCVYVCIRACD